MLRYFMFLVLFSSLHLFASRPHVESQSRRSVMNENELLVKASAGDNLPREIKKNYLNWNLAREDVGKWNNEKLLNFVEPDYKEEYKLKKYSSRRDLAVTECYKRSNVGFFYKQNKKRPKPPRGDALCETHFTRFCKDLRALKRKKHKP